MADKKEDKEIKAAKKETAKPAAKKAKAEASDKVETKSAAPKAKKTGSSGKRAPLAIQTTFAKTGNTVQGKWRLVDATGIPLGRLSTQIAMMLMGKDKPAYTPHIDTGDFVVVVNAEKVKLTGKKWDDKTYHHHTNYPGGIKSYTAKEVKEKNPERLIEWSVWGMLPKSKGHMVRHWHKKLKVYAGAEHPHKAQKVEAVKFTNIGLHGSEA